MNIEMLHTYDFNQANLTRILGDRSILFIDYHKKISVINVVALQLQNSLRKIENISTRISNRIIAIIQPIRSGLKIA